MDLPSSQNRYLCDHAQLLLTSYHQLTGEILIDAAPEESARELFNAPFFVASHTGGDDPVLTYGNQTALDLFEMSWDDFTSTPSRFTAEAPERSERERLLTAVAQKGYIDDYSGIRISSSGRRFEIRNATVWNLIDKSGGKVGQAATFASWKYL